MIRLLALLLILLWASPLSAQQQPAPELSGPRVVLTGSSAAFTVTRDEDAGELPYRLTRGGRVVAEGVLEGGEQEIAGVPVEAGVSGPFVLETVEGSAQASPRVLPGWLSIMPPLLAIAFALIFREVVISLFAGVYLGAFIVTGFNPLAALLRSIDTYVLGGLTGDADRVAIVVFSLLLGGMVGVITRSGGARGVVESLRRYATTRRRGQVLGWVSGLAIFFDDYANTLIRGNTLRPVTDELRISREKLAYIVDSVAAPIAVVAFISTWVGFEISLIGSSLESAAATTTDPAVREQLLAGAANPFNVFLHSIPYLFYPILAMAMVLMIALTGREFGPMYHAEVRAARGEGVYREGAMLAAGGAEMEETKPGAPHRWINAVLPITVVIAVALAGLWVTGSAEIPPEERNVRDVIGAADPFLALLWASFSGVVTAIVLAVSQRILKINEAIDAWVGGMRSMLLAIMILVLAWGLSGITEALGTGTYLAGALQDTLPLALLPVLVFVIAALTAFATGTSWGTMAILFPVVIPLGVAMGAGVGFAGGDHYTVLLGAISSIMAGAVFGDHASPISDTTIISSMASGCDHIDHVRTQLPYALVVAVIAMLVGDIPGALGLNPAISLAAGVLLLYAVLRIFGRPVEVEVPASPRGPEVEPAR
jgi:Na+/H+ antiporter NhaC